MKKIRKTHPPAAFYEWCNENKALNFTYKALCGHQTHKKLKMHLIEEQGFICAYTGLEIADETSHIEHIQPQCTCSDGEDLDYRNMIACFPANGGDISYGYGAPVKGSWWDASLFVSPISEECERRFYFKWSGRVTANSETDQASAETIRVLNLNHNELVSLRKDAINGFFGFSGRGHQLSREEARKVLKVIDAHDSSKKFLSFCFVLKQCLERYCAAGAED